MENFINYALVVIALVVLFTISWFVGEGISRFISYRDYIGRKRIKGSGGSFVQGERGDPVELIKRAVEEDAAKEHDPFEYDNFLQFESGLGNKLSQSIEDK